MASMTSYTLSDLMIPFSEEETRNGVMITDITNLGDLLYIHTYRYGFYKPGHLQFDHINVKIKHAYLNGMGVNTDSNNKIAMD